MKMCQRYLVFLLAVLLLQGACTRNDSGQGIIILDPPPTVPVTDGTGTGQGSGGPSDQSGVTITDIDFPSNPSNDPPFTSIPAELIRPGSVLAFSQDSAGDGEQFNVVIGQAGAVQPCRGEPCVRPNNDIEGALANAGVTIVPEGSRIAISTSELPPPPLPASVDVQLTAPVSSLSRFLISTAHAQEIVINPPVPGARGIDGRCAQPGTVCCPVNTNGAFECSLRLTTASVTQLYIATISSDGRIGPSITEPVQPNLHYLATPAQTLTATQDEIFSLNQNRVVTLGRESDGRFRVRGARSDQYRAYDANDVQSISYDSTNNLLTLKKQNTVDVASLSTTLRNASGIREIAGTSTISLNAGETATEMKLANGLVSYGTRNETPRNEGFIQRIRGLNLPPEPLQFFWQDRLQGVTWLHRETITFDVDSENYAVVVYLDDANNVRLRVGNRNSPRLPDLYADIALNNAEVASLRNLKVYRENLFDQTTRQLQNGRALLIDNTNNRVGTIVFNHVGGNFEIRLDNWLSLGESKNPQTLVLNIARTRAYILNRGDATVTVLRLDTQDGFPEIMNTIDIRQTALPNKEISLTPNTMVYQPSNAGNGQLVIGLENLSGALILDVPTI